MLTLTESINLNLSMEAWEEMIPDDIYDKAEFYDIVYDEGEQRVKIDLYDKESLKLGSFGFEQAEIAIAFLEEMFELEEDEAEALWELDWASGEDTEGDLP